MTNALAIAAALALDRLCGEPPRFHPLVGFGRLAIFIERHLYGSSDASAHGRRARGVAAVLLLIAPVVLLLAWLRMTRFGAVLDVVVLYFALGWRSLDEHARAVRQALDAGNLHAARTTVGRIVSRDTEPMQADDVAKAAVESILENGNDAVFGAIFWFAVAGAPGAALYRLANTLDAMWGYRNTRYLYFGWAAARLDDVLNYIPARLTALGYAAAGRWRNALACWRRQGRAWKSPNAGPVMAAGAGSLGLALGGPAWYGGALEQRPPLGSGRTPAARDIERALRLIRAGIVGWLASLFAVAWLVDVLRA